MSTDRKIAEANEYIRLGEKCLKTSFLKWKPDYDEAASEFSKAATCFKHAKAFPQCKDSYLRAAECFKENHSFFSAAKAIEQAALVCSKDMGDYLESARLLERACRLFQEHGVPDTAALSLDKGAKIIEPKHPERAMSLYLKAAEVVLLEDRPRQAAEYLSKAARLQIKMNRLDDAVETIERELELYAAAENKGAYGRLVVGLVLVHLTRGDYVAAEKSFREGASTLEEDEMQTLSLMLESYDQEDPDGLARALSSSFLKHMDVVFAKLARDLHLPGSILQTGEGRPRTQSFATPTNVDASTVDELTADIGNLTTASKDEAPDPTPGPPPPQDDDDEFSGGLC